MSALTKSNTVIATGLIVKAAPGKLYSLHVHNNRGSAQFIHVYNATTTPVAQNPVVVLSLAAGAYAHLEWHEGLELSTGIFVGNSSTVDTYTIGSADCHFCVQYN